VTLIRTEAREITLFVPGWPVTQGSMSHVGGGRLAHPKKLRPWRDSIRLMARNTAARTGFHHLPEQPVMVDVAFYLPRRGAADLGRKWPTVRSAGDLDKLERAVLDALSTIGHETGILTDDSAVVSLRSRKWYANDDNPPGVVIRVAHLSSPG
jgi:Holliday junction resolvase RusA-like endonuclease